MKTKNFAFERWSLKLLAALVIIYLVILGLITYVCVFLDVQKEQQRFNEKAALVHTKLDALARRNLVTLDGFAALLQAVEVGDKEAISTYARAVLSKHSQISSLEIAQAVPAQFLEQYVADQRLVGPADFRVKNIEDRGNPMELPTDPKADVYYPLIFLEPARPEIEQLLGLDLGSSAAMNAALQRSLITKRVAASRPFALLEGGLGFILVDTVQRRDKTLFAILVCKASDFMLGNSVAPDRLSLSMFYQERETSTAPMWLLGHREGERASALAGWFFPKFAKTLPLGAPEQPFMLSIEEQPDWGIVDWHMMALWLTGSLILLPIMLAYSKAYHSNEKRQLEANNALFFQANFDALTGLPNRQLFMNRLEQSIAIAHRQGLMHGILFLDLDGFKAINDYYGHLIGDKVLVRAARIFQRHVREIDTVARLGGDEFVILLQNIDGKARAQYVAEKIKKAFRQPSQETGKVPPLLGASVGIAVYPQDGLSTAELLAVADRRMYQDKASRKLKPER